MLEEIVTQAFWLGLLKIIGVNIILSGDNAVVIALAARSLEGRQQKLAIIWGSAAAIIMRVILTLFAVKLHGFDGAMGLEQVGLARGRRAAADVNGRHGRLGEHDGRNAGGETGIVGLSDQNAGNVGDQISLRQRSPLRDCTLPRLRPEQCADCAVRDRQVFRDEADDGKRSSNFTSQGVT